jgi:hypothetical protein
VCCRLPADVNIHVSVGTFTQEEGIRVYVMVFKDIVQVVGLNSWHTKVKLISQSPKQHNIKVIRHPDHRLLPGTESSFLFSHHEKTLVIDQRIAFIGGIDLCWGRWDTDQHRSVRRRRVSPVDGASLSFSLARSTRLIDLGDENVTELKLPGDVTNKDIVEDTTQPHVEHPRIGDVAGEKTVGVDERNASMSDEGLLQTSRTRLFDGNCSCRSCVVSRLSEDEAR